jgi:hypothetical protein
MPEITISLHLHGNPGNSDVSSESNQPIVRRPLCKVVVDYLMKEDELATDMLRSSARYRVQALLTTPLRYGGTTKARCPECLAIDLSSATFCTVRV